MNSTDSLEDERAPNYAEMDIKQFLSEIKGENFSYHEWYDGKDGATYCQACYELISGPAYVSDIIDDDYDPDNLTLHKTCGDSPCQIQHPLHPDHPLEADYETLACSCSRNGGFICNGCRHFCFGFGYGCSACDFKLDFGCASNLKIQQPEEDIEIKADFHYHKLQRFYHHTLLSTDPRYLLLQPDIMKGLFHDICCSCCAKGFRGAGLACSKCYLFIHDSCVHKVPLDKQITNSFHLEHPVTLVLSNHRSGFCMACQVPFRHGDLYLTCKEGCISEAFHVSCGTHASSGLKLEKYHRDHPMMCVYLGPASSTIRRPCVACNSECEASFVCSCFGCGVYVHLECIPLPSVIKHECHSYDDHTLVLSDLSNLPDFSSSGEDCCTICEKKADLSHPYYHCEHCSERAHLHCVLCEEDPPGQVLEYLVPRPVMNFQNCSAEQSSAGGQESKSESDLEGYSIEEIDSEIATLELRLEILQRARDKKT